MRRYYLDNLRWATVALVVFYHVFYLFNAVGVLGGFGGFSALQPQDVILYLTHPWFMVLLFVIAGMSARYALETKDTKTFLRSRTAKLLAPSTVGLLVFHWMTGYCNLHISGAWDTMGDVPGVVKYLIMAFSGTGPLWFAQVLWLFSLLLTLVRRLEGKRDWLYGLGGRAGLPALLALYVPFWASSQVLNTPVVIVYRFGIYGFAFLLGWAVFSHDSVQEILKRYHLPLLAAAVALGILFTGVHFGSDFTAYAVQKQHLTVLFTYFAVLALLGCGKAWWDRPVDNILSRNVWGIYVLHYLPLAASALLLRPVLPPAAVYPAVMVCAYAGAIGLYQVLKRIPGVRFWVLGIRGRRT